MGIHGLLPFVKDAAEPINIRKYSGYTVAVDTYCWLHRGAFACAMQLAKGEQTDQYVRYCMKYVNMLRSFNVKPILVFDGCNLPSKKGVEDSRRERRQSYMKKGKQFLREGKVNEARDCFTKCINITPMMALELIKVARSLNVDCIVAPYEADSQLAYLNKSGIADAVITEDSDLIVFGCNKVIVKMDMNGNGLEINSANLAKAMKIGTKYTPDKFRYMCIISGCDYLPSLPGIGLGKARKLFLLSSNSDMKQVLKKMPMHLKMKSVVGEDYIQGFEQANNTFLYQLVFDPLKCKLVPLTPYPPEIKPADVAYAGKYVDNQLALQMALGNINVNTGQRIANFVPNKKPVDKAVPHMLSIWDKNYQQGTQFVAADLSTVKRPTTKNTRVSICVPAFTKEKQIRKEEDIPMESEIDLNLMYGCPSKFDKKVVPETLEINQEETSITKHNHTKVRRNRFAVKRLSSQERKDLLNIGSTQSRFFSSVICKNEPQTSHEHASDGDASNSILLTQLEGTTNVSELGNSDASSIQSRLQKFQLSTRQAITKHTIITSTLPQEIDEEKMEKKCSNGDDPPSEQSLHKQNTNIECTRRQKGVFSWKKKSERNNNELTKLYLERPTKNITGINNLLNAFRRNSEPLKKTLADNNEMDSFVQKEHIDTMTLDESNSETEPFQKFSQISDLYSIDGESLSMASQSQQSSQLLSEDDADCHSLNLKTASQRTIDDGDSQSTDAQDIQKLYPRLPELTIDCVSSGQHDVLNGDEAVHSVFTSSYFGKSSKKENNVELIPTPTTSCLKQNKVRCGLSQRRTRLNTPISTSGRSKTVGLRRQNGTKRKSTNENNMRQVKMSKFFTCKMSDECTGKQQHHNPPLSPINVAFECTPEVESSQRRIEAIHVQRNIFN